MNFTLHLSLFTLAAASALVMTLCGCASAPQTAKPVDPAINTISSAAHKAFARGQIEAAARQFARALEHARAADSATDIYDQAYNLAACFLLVDQPVMARRLLAESRSEAARLNRDATEALLLDAKAARRLGQSSVALALADQAAAANDPAVKLQALIIKALLQSDAGKLQPTELSAIRLLARDVSDAALHAEVENLVGISAQRGRSFGEAAAAFDREAVGWQQAGRFREMAQALARAGGAWQSDGRSADAADRLFRAGRSLAAQGDTVGALKQIEPALTAAKLAGQTALATRVVALFEELKQQVAQPAEPAK